MQAVDLGQPIDMENFYSRLALDIIGKAVFNYEFDSLTHDDPVIQAVYTVLREAEYRSTYPIAYWNLPGAMQVGTGAHVQGARTRFQHAWHSRMLACRRIPVSVARPVACPLPCMMLAFVVMRSMRSCRSCPVSVAAWRPSRQSMTPWTSSLPSVRHWLRRRTRNSWRSS